MTMTKTAKPEMTMVERLRTSMGEFSGRERRVAQALLANFPLAGLDTVSSLAGTAGVSTATVNRFINKLGFTQFSGFQAVLRAQLQETLNSPLARLSAAKKQTRAPGSFVGAYLSAIIGNMEALQTSLPEEEFAEIVSLLCEPRKSIYVVGGRHTSHIGNYLADFLLSLRPRVFPVVGQTARWPLLLQDMDANSVLIAIDMRRYQDDVIEFSKQAAKKGCAIVLLSDQWHSPIAAVARHILAFPVVSPSVYDSAAAGFVICEALAGACAQSLGQRSRTRFAHLDQLRAVLETGDASANKPRSD
jgi:DNA-binding MurR/RpiR family transcriptional regulator